MNAVTTHETLLEGETIEMRAGVPFETLVLAPDNARIVRASEVAETASKYGLRGAAEIYYTSAPTIGRFLKQNGYKAQSASRWVEARNEQQSGERKEI